MMENVWTTSTLCDSGSCVQVQWRRCSTANNCVEVGTSEGQILVRNSADPDGPVLTYTEHDWRIELGVIRRDGMPFDAAVRTDDGQWQWSYMGKSIWCTRDEMDAFVAGVNAGEFDPHPESRCSRCGGPNVAWTAPSPLWNAVMRGGTINGDEEYDGIVCPTCFAVLAEVRGIAGLWRMSADRVLVELETVTPSGRSGTTSRGCGRSRSR